MRISPLPRCGSPIYREDPWQIFKHICDDCSLSHWLLLKKSASHTPRIVKKSELLNILLTFRIIPCFDCVHFRVSKWIKNTMSLGQELSPSCSKSYSQTLDWERLPIGPKFVGAATLTVWVADCDRPWPRSVVLVIFVNTDDRVQSGNGPKCDIPSS